MAKVKHNLRLQLSWDYPRETLNESNEYGKFMNPALLNSLKVIKDKYPDINWRQYTHNNLLGKSTRWGTRIDIDFNLRTDRHGSWKDDLKDTPECVSFGNLTKALHEIDELLKTVPKECNPSGKLSTLDYRNPWVNVITIGGHPAMLFMPREADTYTLEKLGSLDVFRSPDDEFTNIARIRVVGEPHESLKVYRYLKKLTEHAVTVDIGKKLHELYEQRTNSNWAMIITDGNGKNWVFGYGAYTRKPMSLETADLMCKPFEMIEHKYPLMKRFGQDMKHYAIL